MDTTLVAPRRLRARVLATLTAALMLVTLAPTLSSPAGAVTPTTPGPTAALTSAPTLVGAMSGAERWRRRRIARRFAIAQIGKPYIWGGSGPRGYDCSGLTSASWAAAGKWLPHSSRMQYQRVRKVSARKKKVGDLIFYGNPIHHVAIYVGNGKMVEAPRRGLNVRKVRVRSRNRRGFGRVL